MLLGAGLPAGPAYDVALGPVLLRHGLGAAQEVLRVHRPAPTAAFSRRDTLRPGFQAAAEAVRRLGFAPVLRPQGGRLAVYHSGSVVVDHVVRTTRGRTALTERFRHYADLLAASLARPGLDLRVGEVPGEYCPGEFSLNVGGTQKVAGSAQRVTRDGWVFSTVVQVTGAGVLREALAAAYDALGYQLDPSTVGVLADAGVPLGAPEVAAAVRSAYGSSLPVVALPSGLLPQVAAEAASRTVG